MIEELILKECNISRSFVYGGELSIYEILLKATEKINELVYKFNGGDYVNNAQKTITDGGYFSEEDKINYWGV